MNLDFYRNYIAIVECGTLSAAARTLHVAQSALSTQVRQFESEYGARLFVRSARRMEPTDAGRILYDKAKRVVMLVDESHREIDACVEGAQGTVRIGMTQAYPDTDMTRLLLAFHRENPRIRYAFYECSSGEIMELVRTGVTEVGVIRSAGLLPPYLEEALTVEQQLCAYCRRDNPWLPSTGETVPLRALDRVPLAISRGFEPLLTDVFQRADVRPVVMSVSTSRSNPSMWAKAGAMVAVICADDAAAFDDADMFCRPLAAEDSAVTGELKAARSFVVAKGRSLSAAAQRFLRFSQTHYGR